VSAEHASECSRDAAHDNAEAQSAKADFVPFQRRVSNPPDGRRIFARTADALDSISG
jgi:hypothetical protein